MKILWKITFNSVLSIGSLLNRILLMVILYIFGGAEQFGSISKSTNSIIFAGIV